jgi:5'-3' exonuclease
METTTMTEDVSKAIILRTIQHIKEYIHAIKPSKRVIIAFDGVAPVAKLEQQRSRRFKSLYQSNLSKTILKNVSDPWNTTSITPGTVFMKMLDERIAEAFATPSAFNLDQIVVSGSNMYGEGEHKIFKYIRDHSDYHKDTTTVIYGLDADLIMLSINHLPIAKRLYLFRETPEFIKSIHCDLEPNESYVLDIPELAKAITLNMNNDTELNEEQQTNRIYDYIFLCFFLANDFLPHFPSINIRTGGMDKLLLAYKETIGNTNNNLTNGKTIYWRNVIKLVSYLAKNEEEYFKQEHKLRDRREKRKLPDITPEDKINNFINVPTFERTVEKYINPYKSDWQTRYYKALFQDKFTQASLCRNYLEGLEWTMKYYTTGCPNWRWRYNYNYPPLLQDLIEYIPFFDTEFVETVAEKPVSELVQLCYVMPRQSLHMLPDTLYNRLIKERLELYKTDCTFSWAYCKYFWECHPNLPHIDVDELEEFVHLSTFEKGGAKI